MCRSLPPVSFMGNNMTERIDRRVLGAIRLRSRATGEPVVDRMMLSGEDARFVRNRSHLYVITSAPGLEAHEQAFSQPPTEPALGSVEVTVTISDPAGRYLPRTLIMNLPRDPDPEHRDDENSLFRPVEANLYPSATAPIDVNWSTVRASVMWASDATPVAGALLRVVRTVDEAVLASGLSDPQGEALVIIPGIPITNFATEEDEEDEESGMGPVVVSEVPARLEVSYNPGADWPLDMDAAEAAHTDFLRATQALTLRTGRMERVTIQLT